MHLVMRIRTSGAEALLVAARKSFSFSPRFGLSGTTSRAMALMTSILRAGKPNLRGGVAIPRQLMVGYRSDTFAIS